jgi:hypothetical protein
MLELLSRLRSGGGMRSLSGDEKERGEAEVMALAGAMRAM